MSFSTIGGRLLLIPALCLFGFIIIGWMALSTLERSMMDGREARVVAVVEVVTDLIDHYQERAAKGEITTEEAQEQAKNAVRNLRYSGTEYFWINDLGRPTPTMASHRSRPGRPGIEQSQL